MVESAENRKALCDLLLDIAEAEKHVEVSKGVMLDIRDFSSVALFRRLTGSSQITFADFDGFLRESGANLSEEDSRLVFESLDRDCDGVLGWGEFLNSCVSREFSPETSGFPHSWREHSGLSQEAETALVLTIMKELEGLRNIERSKAELIGHLKVFQLEDLFDLLDTEQKGYISLVNLWNFLKREGGAISLKVAERCFRRLDLDSDSRIYLKEWVLSLSPLRVLQSPKHPGPKGFTSPKEEELENRFEGTQAFGASSTASDFRGSGRKFNQTVRSTADKTFSTTRVRGFGPQDKSVEKHSTPNRVITTEIYNYFEDDVPVEKEVTTKITRALPFDSQSEEFVSSRKYLKKNFQSAYRFEDDYVIHEEKEDHSQQQPEASRQSNFARDSEIKIKEQSPVGPGEKEAPKLEEQSHSRHSSAQAEDRRAQIMPSKNLSRPRDDSLERPIPSKKSSLQEAPVPPAQRPPSAKEKSYLPPKPQPDSQRNQASLKLSEHSKNSLRDDFKRYLKPNQQKSSVNENSTQRFSQLTIGGKSLVERYRELNARRNPNGVTLERNAMRGVLKKPTDTQEEPRDLEASIFERKHLPAEVPKKTLPKDFERTFDTERKSAYEKSLLNAAQDRANGGAGLPQYEKNSMSHFDITEGKTTSEQKSYKFPNHSSGMSWKEKDRLVSFLVEAVRDFRIQEQKRINVAMRFDLKLEELFMLADEDQVNSLSPEDFCRFVKKLEVDLDFDSALFLFSVFDRDEDRFLDFEEFSQVFAPFNNEYREALLHKSNRRIVDIGLYDRETVKALRDCLATVFNVEKKLAHYKQELDGRLYELFDLIDAKSTGSLTLQDFKDLFERHGFQASNMEVSALMARLDLDRDGRITPAEFLSELRDRSVDYEKKYLSSRKVKPSQLVLDHPHIDFPIIRKKSITTTHSCEEPGFVEEKIERTETHSPRVCDRHTRHTTIRTQVERSYSPETTDHCRLPARRHKFGDKSHKCGWDLC